MVNVSIVASGTRGDVQPYVALGQGLQQAGYRVRVLTNENFEQLVTEAGLDFASTGENIEAILQSEEWRKTTESGNFLKILGKMQSEMKRHADRIEQTIGVVLCIDHMRDDDLARVQAINERAHQGRLS